MMVVPLGRLIWVLLALPVMVVPGLWRCWWWNGHRSHSLLMTSDSEISVEMTH